MTGGELATLQAEYPRWQIRWDDAGYYVAFMPGKIVKRPSAVKLRAALVPSAEDGRLGNARRLLAELHQPAMMAPNEMFRLLGQYQKALAELVEVIDARTW